MKHNLLNIPENVEHVVEIFENSSDCLKEILTLPLN